MLARVFEHPRSDLLCRKVAGEYRPLSTSEFESQVRSLAQALIERGVQSGDRVLLLSENRPEWSIADFAILAAGAITVPIYPTLLPEQIEYIVRDTGASIAFVSTPGQYEKIRKTLRSAGGYESNGSKDDAGEQGLKSVIVFDPNKPPGSWVTSLEETYAEGAAADRRDPARLETRRREVTTKASQASSTPREPPEIRRA